MTLKPVPTPPPSPPPAVVLATAIQAATATLAAEAERTALLTQRLGAELPPPVRKASAERLLDRLLDARATVYKLRARAVTARW